MKHKLNNTVEAGSKLTTLFNFFTLRNRERKLVQWLLEVEIFTPCSGGSRPTDKGGGGGHPDPEMRGGGRPPFSGSATAMYLAAESFLFA